jgi:hypothetical protein
MRSALLALCISLISFGSHAQTFRGSISGSVADTTGSAVPGAGVEVTQTQTGLKRNTTTSGSGEFTFADLPTGDYQLLISQPGFETVKVQQVTVEVGKAATIHLTLKVATQATTVEVSANSILIDSETATLNAVIPNKAVQDMPLNGRDFTQLIKFAPGVNGAGSVNGTRTSQNNCSFRTPWDTPRTTSPLYGESLRAIATTSATNTATRTSTSATPSRATSHTNCRISATVLRRS